MKEAPYGSWKSPITADLIVAKTIGLGQIALDGDDLYWTEMRPTEGGRYVVVRRTPDGATTDLTPAPFNARTRVHEYGGGSFLVVGGTVYFSNFADQRLYRQDPGAEPRPLTPAVDMRYADGVMDRRRGRILTVREDHTTGAREAVNTLVAVNAEGDEGGGTVLVEGSDFYASPRLSPDGTQLAWLSWNHPNLPWDGCELWVGRFDPLGNVEDAQKVAGGEDESIFQPEWSPNGTLYFVSDRTGWWNLYRWRGGVVEPLWEADAEFGEPLWVFGMRTFAFESARRLVCAFTRDGLWHLAALDTETLQHRPIETPYSDIDNVHAAPGRVIFTGGSPTEFNSLVMLDLPDHSPLTPSKTAVLRRSNQAEVDSGYLSTPEPIEFPTEGGKTAHGFFYRPRNRDYIAPGAERPPLVVRSHGGPTGATNSTLRLGIQYWTSRGIAVLDVNYGGSTGYGREYRQRLDGQWGVVDVDDCTNGALYLAEQGKADRKRLAITGGSAGGYTTLCALTFRDVFGAGASHFGLSELETFVDDTHKFESRYLDRLIGPYPERKDLYYARSPIRFTDRLNCPVIFFQGLEDKIVPPNQAEMMVEALREKGLPVAYVPFEGEQHGFRKAENIKRALDGELYFYARVFGFEPADDIEPVPIDNMPDP